MYQTFLRKQILDHSSNEKCYIKTVLGSLTAFVGDGTLHVDSHAWTTPELLWAPTVSYSITVCSEGGEGWTLARMVGGKRARSAVCWDINFILKQFLAKVQHSSLTAAQQYEGNTGTGWVNEDFKGGPWSIRLALSCCILVLVPN